MDEKFTSLRVGMSTRDKLIKFRLYRRETHEEVIERLMNFYLEAKANEKPKQ